ncbi:MAG: winged helix-turn-helix domain-containing protein [Planctomycetaceae bacterium]
MATIRVDAAQEIGTTAGAVWQYLNSHGPTAVSALTKELEAPRDVVLQGIGWLAREGKVEYVPGKGNAKIVGLTDT